MAAVQTQANPQSPGPHDMLQLLQGLQKYILMSAYIHTYIHTYVYMYICIYMYTYINIYIYATFTLMYIYIYIHTHIYICIICIIHVYIQIYVQIDTVLREDQKHGFGEEAWPDGTRPAYF